MTVGQNLAAVMPVLPANPIEQKANTPRFPVHIAHVEMRVIGSSLDGRIGTSDAFESRLDCACEAQKMAFYVLSQCEYVKGPKRYPRAGARTPTDKLRVYLEVGRKIHPEIKISISVVCITVAADGKTTRQSFGAFPDLCTEVYGV